MTVVSHVRELRKKHQALSEAVEEAQKSLAIDDLQVFDAMQFASALAGAELQ